MAESGWLLGGELSASTWALRHGGEGGGLRDGDGEETSGRSCNNAQESDNCEWAPCVTNTVPTMLQTQGFSFFFFIYFFGVGVRGNF